MKAKLVTLLGFITILSISFILFLESNTEKKIRIIENSIKQQDDSLLSNSYLFIKENASFNNKLLTRKTDLNYTIIDDINFTLQQCRDKIVTGFLPFNVFCEYILPPVIYQESFENWRLSCIKEFSFIYHVISAAAKSSRYEIKIKGMNILKNLGVIIKKVYPEIALI